MADFLNAFLSVIPEGQKQDILACLERRRSTEGLTDRDFQTRLNQLLGRIDPKGRKPGFQPVEPLASDVVKAEFFNEAWEQIHIDLAGAYKHFGQLVSTIEAHRKVNTAVLDQAKQAVSKLLEDVFTYTFLRANPEFNDVRLNDFVSSRNFSSKTNRAVVDQNLGQLRGAFTTQDRFLHRKGPFAPKVTVNQLTESGSLESSAQFSPENAVDSNPKNFWAEVLAVDAPVVTTYRGMEYQGALMEFRVDLPQSEFVNNLRILPFAKFPLAVVDVRLQDGDDILQLPGFSTTAATQDWLNFNFERLRANAISIIFQQQNTTQRIIHVPKDQFNRINLWEQLIQKAAVLEFLEEELSQDQRQRIELNRREGTYQNALNELARLGEGRQPTDSTNTFAVLKHTASLLTDVLSVGLGGEREQVLALLPKEITEFDQSNFVEIRKFEYVFGALSIELNHQTFDITSHFESQKYAPKTTLIEVQLETDEANVILDEGGADPHVESGTEYEIEIAPERSIPIVPTNVTTVHERLAPDNTSREAPLRFSGGTGHAVRKNGVVTADWSIDGPKTKITIGEATFAVNAIFTVDYDPPAAAKVINLFSLFDSKPREEVFSGTDSSGILTLEGFPFVLFDIIDSPDWLREDPFDARYRYRIDRGMIEMDGRTYGELHGRVGGSIGDAVTSMTVNIDIIEDPIVTGVPLPDNDPAFQFHPLSTGLVRVGNEVMAYTGVTGTPFNGPFTFVGGVDTRLITLTGLTRGSENTNAAAHSLDDNVEFIADHVYDPVLVTVDGVRAQNITNYTTGEHPAFVFGGEQNNRYQYVQIGSVLYFSAPVSGEIRVQYDEFAAYAKLKATLRANTIGIPASAPYINQYTLKIKASPL